MPNDLQGLQLLGNAMALPKRLENASQQSAMTRALLSQNADVLGLTPAQIDQLAPDPGLGAINPTQHPGTYGKILSGVGGVGNVISSLLGNPVEAPRLDLSTITSLSSLREKGEKKKALGKYAETLPDEGSKALALAGYPASAAKANSPSKGSTSELGVLIQEGVDQGLDLAGARSRALKEIDTRKTGRAVAQGKAMTPVLTDRGEAAADISLRKKFKEDAGVKLTQLGNVERIVFPLMDQAQTALSTSPLVVGSGAQRPIIWFKALLGDKAAQAVRTLPSQAAALARTQDVGNLSGPEQQVWHAFINGEDMTAQQFTVAIQALKKVLGNSARYYREQYKTGDVPVTESEQTPPESGAPPAPGSGGGDELDQLLKQHGH